MFLLEGLDELTVLLIFHSNNLLLPSLRLFKRGFLRTHEIFGFLIFTIKGFIRFNLILECSNKHLSFFLFFQEWYIPRANLFELFIHSLDIIFSVDNFKIVHFCSVCENVIMFLFCFVFSVNQIFVYYCFLFFLFYIIAIPLSLFQFPFLKILLHFTSASTSSPLNFPVLQVASASYYLLFLLRRHHPLISNNRSHLSSIFCYFF